MMQGGKTMRCSSGWSAIVILAILLTPLAGMSGVPVQTAHAAPATPAATYDSEIILLSSAAGSVGQIRVDDPNVPAGVKPAAWNSGTDIGYTAIAVGDFNGDGDGEIVAARGSTIKVFDPIVQPNSQLVSFEVNLGSGRNVRLLATGDFDGDGKAEFAAVHVESATNIQAALRVYDGGTNATASQWRLVNSALYGMMWQDMAAGDFNADGADDLVMVRNPSQQSKLVHVFNVKTWTTMAEGNYNFSWLAAAAGNFSSSTAGDEMALSRRDVLGSLDSVLLFRVSGSTIIDLLTAPNYRFYPYFGSMAAGDLNGDGDDEALLLRDPNAPSTSLLMLNPSGASMRAFERADGYGATAWKSVRAGDVDGDGRAEPVLLRSDRYRVYTQPEINDTFTDVTGSFYFSSTSTDLGTNNLPFLVVADVDGPGVRLGPVLSVTPSALSFTLEYRATSPTKTIAISNAGTSDAISWQAAAVDSPAWLKLASTSGSTPSTLGVSVDTSVIGPGSYSGKIRITATSPSGVQASPQDVTVSVTITGVTMVVTPTLLDFTIGYGDTVAAKQVTIASQGGSAPFSWRAIVQSGSDWLVVSPLQGTTPTTLSVGVNSRAKTPGGPYLGSIMFVTDDANIADPIQYVTVRLTVTDVGLVVAPDTVTIKRLVGAPVSTAQVQIERPGIATPWTATVLPAALADVARAKLEAGEYQATEAGIVFDGLEAPAVDWLAVTPTSGTTPTTMTLAMQGSTPGVYKATVFVNSSAGTREVHVTGWVAGHFYASYAPLALK